MRKIFFCLLCCTLLYSCVLPVYAHPGGTDWNGGHTNHSTGEYHYHHGENAHDHYDIDGDGSKDCMNTYKENAQKQASRGLDEESPYGKGFNSGFDDGYDVGYDAGKAVGEGRGYRSGFDDGEDDMETVMQAKLEAEVKDAKQTAYGVSLFYGAPLVAFISAYLASKGYEKRESELTQEVMELRSELRTVKRSSNFHSTSSSPLPKPPVTQTSFLTEKPRNPSRARTVYISKHGSKYHCKYRCSNATTAVNLDDLPLTYEPCRNCVPRNMIRRKP